MNTQDTYSFIKQSIIRYTTGAFSNGYIKGEAVIQRATVYYPFVVLSKTHFYEHSDN